MAGGIVFALYVALFARGLAWEWRLILAPPAAGTAGPTGARSEALAPVPASQRRAPEAAQGQAPAPAPNPAAARPLKTPLSPSSVPPPRNATDEYGVSYDAAGVGVMGIDADTGGVYNVPPGRQVRIGGPTGQLFDVGPDGKLVPATQIKAWPE